MGAAAARAGSGLDAGEACCPTVQTRRGRHGSDVLRGSRRHTRASEILEGRKVDPSPSMSFSKIS